MYPIFYPSPHLNIPSYLIVMSLAFTLSVIYFYKRAIKNNLPPPISAELSLVIMIGAFLGSRLFHVIFEYPQYYLDQPLEVFKFYKGGFVFYGGFTGGIIGAFVYLKLQRQNFFNWLDCFAPVLSFGYIIGRFACLLAGCCYGSECDLPWAIRFPSGVEAPANIALHPTQIYSIILEGVLLGVLLFFEKSRSHFYLLKKSGTLFYIWMIGHGIGRLTVEQFRADFRGEPFFGLSISSILSLIIVAVGIFLLIYKRESKNSL